MNPIRASWFLPLTRGVISIANPIDPPAIGAVAPQSESSKDESDNAGEVLSGYFGPQVDDLKKLGQMDLKKDFAEAGQGCKEIEPSAKHHR